MSSKTMAKRAAAGTLALAVCLTGGAVAFAGAANAAVPDGGLIRVLPSANPTLNGAGTGGVGNQSAPVLQSGVTGQAIATVQVVVPNGWVAGDQVRLSLPSGVTFSADSPAEPSVSSATTADDLAVHTTAQSMSTYSSLTAPKTSTAYQSGGVNKSTISTTLSNSSASNSGSGSPVFVLTFSDLKVDVASTFSGAVTVTPTAWAAGSGGTYAQTSTAFSHASTIAGFASPVQVSQPSGQILTPGDAGKDGKYGTTDDVASPPQSIGDITLSESAMTGLINGTYTLTFEQGGVPLTVDNVDPDGDTFDAQITASGAANRGGGTVALGTGGTSVNLALTGLKADTGLEAVKLSNIRVETINALPVQTVLTAAASFSLPFAITGNGTATAGDSNTPFSRTVAAEVKASSAISVTQAGNRIGGADRYGTAAAIAQQGLTPRANGLSLVDTVIVASGEQGGGGVDALSANYLAGQLGAPILLTQHDSVPDVTMVALRNLLDGDSANPRNARIIVIGGPNAVNDSVVAQLKDAFASSFGNLTVQRVAGTDRYATAASSATTLGASYSVGTYSAAYGKGAAATAFITNGITPADALSAGPIAYSNHFPVLLSGVDSVPQASLDAIDSLGIRNIVLTGGTAAVSANVEAQLKAKGLSVYRVAGTDRYETATKLYKWATLSKSPSSTDPIGGLGYKAPTSPYLANGMSFADALVAGPLAGRQTVTTGTGTAATTAAAPQPLLLTDPAKLSDATSAYLTDNKQSINGTVIGVGLAAALPQATLQAAADASRN